MRGGSGPFRLEIVPEVFPGQSCRRDKGSAKRARLLTGNALYNMKSKHRRIVVRMIICALAAWLIFSPVVVLADAVVGKKYYPNGEVTVLRMELNELPEWIIVEKELSVLEYEISTSSGKHVKSHKGIIDSLVRRGALVDYDPIAKAAADKKKREQDEAERKRSAATAEAARQKNILAKPWPPQIREAVIKKEVRLGMTSEQVTVSWGKPGRINRTVNAVGTREQWVYGSTYLYFDNDRLTSFQDSR